MKELVKIQTELKASKDLYNSFAKYAYRSAESILEALKPLLKETGCVVLLSDDIKEVGQPFAYATQNKKNGQETNTSYDGTRVYVEATATIINSSGASISVKAYARENVEKAGMDVGQVTGAASSYARKYALCGLFAIDDGRDNDSSPNTPITEDKLKGDFDKAQKKIAACKTRAELTTLNEKFQSLWQYQPYINAINAKYQSLPQ